MKQLNLLTFFIPFLIITFQGCDSSSTQKILRPTAIGESASIVTDEPNAEMAPSREALEAVSNQIGAILKLHIQELNEKEAISFDREMNYCDLSGLKKAEHQGDLEKITMKSDYQTCKGTNTLQDGEIQVTFKDLNENGQFPKSLEMTSPNAYQFNNLTLNQDTFIEGSDITYNRDDSVKSITLKINGTLYNYTQKIELTNYLYQVLF